MNLTSVLLICLSFTTAFGYNILFMGPFPAPSHWMWLENFVDGLLERGHHVTVVTNYKRKIPHENCTELIIDPPYDIPKYCKYSVCILYSLWSELKVVQKSMYFCVSVGQGFCEFDNDFRLIFFLCGFWGWIFYHVSWEREMIYITFYTVWRDKLFVTNLTLYIWGVIYWLFEQIFYWVY